MRPSTKFSLVICFVVCSSTVGLMLVFSETNSPFNPDLSLSTGFGASLCISVGSKATAFSLNSFPPHASQKFASSSFSIPQFLHTFPIFFTSQKYNSKVYKLYHITKTCTIIDCFSFNHSFTYFFHSFLS